MQAVMPHVPFTNDTEDGIMRRSGKIVGFSRTRVLWQFGFLPNSDMAKAFNVSTDGFYWVIADYQGGVIEMACQCYWIDLPERYTKIVDANR